VIEPLLPGTSRSRGVTARDNRLFLEAVLWKVRVGGPWRDGDVPFDVEILKGAALPALSR